MGSSAFQPLLCLSKRWSPPFNSFHQPFSVFLGFGTGGVGGVSWARTKWRRSGPPSPIVPSNTLGRQLISFNSSQDMQRDTKDRNSAHSLRGGRRSSRFPLFLQLVLFQEETSLTSSLLSLSYLLLKKWQVFSFTFPSPANSKLSKSLPVSSTFFFLFFIFRAYQTVFRLARFTTFQITCTSFSCKLLFELKNPTEARRSYFLQDD